jgi:tetratricopeptide (TPR) repeat protein
MFILLSSEDILYKVTTIPFSAKGRSQQVSAELFLTTKRALPSKQAAEQNEYINTAAQAAFASLNKLDWTNNFYAYVQLTSSDSSYISFERDSTSSGLGYGLSLALEWRKQLGKSHQYQLEVFATGSIHSSGALTAIGHLDNKINAACKMMEQRMASSFDKTVDAAKDEPSFVILFPNANQADVTHKLATRVADAGGILYPIESLQSALVYLLGDDYDGEANGRWEPFKGLSSFDYQDNLRFFGRERALNKLIDEYKQAHGLFVVMGVSGSGKSSLVKAGLIPYLYQHRAEGEAFDWLISTPKSHNSIYGLITPLLELLSEHWALNLGDMAYLTSQEYLKEPNPVETILQLVLRDPVDFIKHLQKAQAGHPFHKICWYIDQYEDVFNHQNYEREQGTALAPLLARIAKEVDNLDIIISIRSDYESILGKYGDVSHVSPNLNPDEWGDIVRKQAMSFGLNYEPGLDTIIINEASGIENGLPALEYLLSQLYLKAKQLDLYAITLTHSHYTELKGIQGVIAALAEATIATYPKQADAFFEYFVGLDDEGRACTKSVLLTDIEQQNPALAPLVQEFIKQRLVIDCGNSSSISHTLVASESPFEGGDHGVSPPVTALTSKNTSEKYVKLAHDSLLQEKKGQHVPGTSASWLRLHEWLTRNHDFLVWYKDIQPNFLRWCQFSVNQDNETPTDALLLSKFDLQRIQDIQSSITLYNTTLQRYIQKSQQNQINVLERTRKTQRKRIAVITVLLVVAISVSIFALVQRQLAIDERIRAEILLTQIGSNHYALEFDLPDYVKQHISVSEQRIFLPMLNQFIERLHNNIDDTLSDEDLLRIAAGYTHKSYEILSRDQNKAYEALQRVEKALQIHEKCVTRTPSNIDCQRNLSNSYSRLGYLQSLAGNVLAALNHYQTGLRYRKALVENDPDNSDVQESLAQSHNALGILQTQRGDDESALIHYKAALQIREALLENDPNNSDAQRIVALIHIVIGNLNRVRGDIQAALTHHKSALRINKSLLESDQADSDAKLDLANTQFFLGALEDDEGDFQAAFVNHKAALQIRKTLAVTFPNNADVQGSLAHSHIHLGMMERRFGNLQVALTHIKTALRIRKSLVYDAPDNSNKKGDLAYSHTLVGILQTDLGDIEAALAQHMASLLIRKSLVENEPDNADAQDDLAIVHSAIGFLQEEKGDSQSALTHFAAVLLIRQTLVKNAPDNTGFQRMLANSHSGLGYLHKERGDFQAALTQYEAALQIRKVLAENDLDNADVQVSLAAAYDILGLLHIQRGDFQVALTQYEAALQIRKVLAENDLDNSDVQGSLAAANESLGLLHIQRSDLNTASKHFEAALHIRKALVKNNPDNKQNQLDLSTSYILFGFTHEHLGNIKAALMQYKASLRISKAVAESDPDNVNAQNSLALSYSSLGEFQENRGNFQAALIYYETALLMKKALVENGSDNEYAQDILASSLNSVGRVHKNLGDSKTSVVMFKAALLIRKALMSKDSSNTDTKKNTDELEGYRDDPQTALTHYDTPSHVTNVFSEQSASDALFQRDLLFNDGNLQLRLMNINAALEKHKLALKITTELVNQDPGNIEFLRDLFISFATLGDVMMRLDNRQAALVYYEDALSIDKMIAGQGLEKR